MKPDKLVLLSHGPADINRRQDREDKRLDKPNENVQQNKCQGHK